MDAVSRSTGVSLCNVGLPTCTCFRICVLCGIYLIISSYISPSSILYVQAHKLERD